MCACLFNEKKKKKIINDDWIHRKRYLIIYGHFILYPCFKKKKKHMFTKTRKKVCVCVRVLSLCSNTCGKKKQLGKKLVIFFVNLYPLPKKLKRGSLSRAKKKIYTVIYTQGAKVAKAHFLLRTQKSSVCVYSKALCTALFMIMRMCVTQRNSKTIYICNTHYCKHLVRVFLYYFSLHHYILTTTYNNV